MRLAVNARFLGQPRGGQQRVAAEISARLGGDPLMIQPGRPLEGVKGHLWEQAVLPLRARRHLLWSPSATGPVLHPRHVVTIHDVAFLDVPQFFGASFVRLYQALIPALVRRAAHVVTVSTFSKTRLVEAYGANPDAISVIPNAASAAFRPASPDEVAAVRRKYRLPERWFLLQATADRRKNLARVIEAWRQIQDEVPGMVLAVTGRLAGAHVFGSGDDAPMAGMMEPERLLKLGFVEDDDLAALMTGATAFLFPSLYEGFGLPIIEAMACGAPVITGDGSAMPEAAGGAALTVDATSAGAIGAAMLRLAREPGLAQELSAHGRLRAAQFTWDQAAADYRALFERLG